VLRLDANNAEPLGGCTGGRAAIPPAMMVLLDPERVGAKTYGFLGHSTHLATIITNENLGIVNDSARCNGGSLSDFPLYSRYSPKGDELRPVPSEHVRAYSMGCSVQFSR
jgi:hypothetical protein